MGRPRLKIDAQKVEMLASVGCSASEIAAELNVGERTLWRRFGAVLERGAKKRDVRLRSALIKYALRGNAPLLIFCAKSILGLRENDPATIINATAIAGQQQVPLVTEEAKAKLAALGAEIMSRARAHGNGQEPPDRLGLAS